MLIPDTPDDGPCALVLSGGGARAAYQVGVLAAIAEKAPAAGFKIITGVSAGAINTAYLAAFPGSFGAAVQGLRGEWARLTVDKVYTVRPFSIAGAVARALSRLLHGRAGPATMKGLMEMGPLRRFLDGCVDLGGIQANLDSGRLHAVGLSSTSYGTGRTVTFVQGHESIPMWERSLRVSRRTTISLDHVLASAAIPIVFPAVRIEDEFFGDGSVRLTAPLAPAIHLGARRILAIGMRTAQPAPRSEQLKRAYPTAAEAMALLFHSIFLDALETDSERLDQVNAVLQSLSNGSRAPRDLQLVRLLVLKPSRDLGAMAKGHTLLLPPLIRMAVRFIGGGLRGGSDFLSYLLFDPAYTGQLVELGYHDGIARWSEISDFLCS